MSILKKGELTTELSGNYIIIIIGIAIGAGILMTIGSVFPSQSHVDNEISSLISRSDYPVCRRYSEFERISERDFKIVTYSRNIQNCDSPLNNVTLDFALTREFLGNYMRNFNIKDGETPLWIFRDRCESITGFGGFVIEGNKSSEVIFEKGELLEVKQFGKGVGICESDFDPYPPGTRCEEDWQCWENLSCNPSLDDSDEKFCCPGEEQWNGTQCLWVECNDFVCESQDCRYGCEECEGPDPICVGDGYCTKEIDENCDTSEDCSCKIPEMCCPNSPDEMLNDQGCVLDEHQNKSKGEECFCNGMCDSSEGLYCNPTTSIFEDFNSACCPPGKAWNGTDCEYKTDVLVVALESNFKSAYSDEKIEGMEKKVEEFSRSLAKNDGLGARLFYLDSNIVKNIVGKKVTSTHSWSNIDTVLDLMIEKLDSKYLIILGGHKRFPQAPVGSPSGSDNPFGDVDGGGSYRLDIPVGRIPEPNNGDMKAITNALDTYSDLHDEGGLVFSDYISPIMGCGGIDNRDWTSGKCFCSAIWSSGCSACGSCCGCISPSQTSGKNFVSILAHGPGPASCDLLMGGCFDSGSGSCIGHSGFGPSDMASMDHENSVWFSMACGGGHLKQKSSTSGSIAMTFLKTGGAVYAGSTDLNYGSMGSCSIPGGDGMIGSLYTEIAKEFKEGKTIGEAYMQGKNNYVSQYSQKADYHYHINMLYGDPTLKIKKLWN